MAVEIIYPTESYFASFYEALTTVARERIYLEMIEPPPFEKVAGFQRELIQQKGPVFYAVDEGRVVGWCDAFPSSNPRQSHRAFLGMGLLPEYRGQGIGTKLVQAVIAEARTAGLDKLELHVYTSNPAAIALYRKLGFVEEGFIKSYRKLDGQIFDALSMALFL